MAGDEAHDDIDDGGYSLPARVVWLIYAVALTAIVFTLVGHTLKWGWMQADTTTLGLIALLLILPLAPFITELSFGGMTWKIDLRRRIRKAREDVASLPPGPQVHKLETRDAPGRHDVPSRGTVGRWKLSNPTRDAISWYLPRSPTLALMKLRIDLERELGALAGLAATTAQEKSYLAAHADGQTYVGILLGHGVLSRDEAAALLEVLSILNQAQHSRGRVSHSDAAEITELGLQLHERLLAIEGGIRPDSPDDASDLPPTRDGDQGGESDRSKDS